MISPRHPSTALSAHRPGGIGLRRSAVRAFRQIVGRRAQDGDRLASPRRCAPACGARRLPLIDRHAERVMSVGGVRVIAPDVQIDARSAAGHAHDAQHLGLFRAQDAGVLQTVAGGIGRLNQRDQSSRIRAPRWIEPYRASISLVRQLTTRGARRPRTPCRAASGSRSAVRSGAPPFRAGGRHARWRPRIRRRWRSPRCRPMWL